jgi:hypothetical protein
MSENFKTLRFHLVSTDLRAYLCARGDDGQSVIINMSQSSRGFWFVDVPLKEGTYYTWYYCGDEHSVTYHGPAPLDGSPEDGLDAVVVVA